MAGGTGDLEINLADRSECGEDVTNDAVVVEIKVEGLFENQGFTGEGINPAIRA